MIDPERLARWMDGIGLAGKGGPIEHRFVSGGTQNEIYEVRRGGLRCAMRIPPAAAPAGRDEGIYREWRIIEGPGRHRCAPHRGRRHVHRHLGPGPGLLPDGFRRRVVADGPARLAPIVDWEMGTVGDPKLDLAWMLQSWPEDTSSPTVSFSSYADLFAMPPRSALLARYSEVSGRQVDDIDYYLVLAKWKLAVVLEQGFQRAGDDIKLQSFGPVVLELMKGAAELAESTDWTGA